MVRSLADRTFQPRFTFGLSRAPDERLLRQLACAVHGVFFVVLVVMFLIGWGRVPLTGGMTILGIIGAIIPFGPFYVDLKLARLLDSNPAESD